MSWRAGLMTYLAALAWLVAWTVLALVVLPALSC